MDITDYTTYDEVRSVCGLSTDELTDTELALTIYANVLDLAMADVTLPTAEPGPGPLTTRFIALNIIAETARTTAQQKLFNLTRVFCTCTVALQAVMALSMRAPKTISDSKASLVRFSPESVYKDVIDRLEKTVGEAKGKMENIATTTLDVLPLLTVVEPSTDAITGA
jgi:hypothetical protein